MVYASNLHCTLILFSSLLVLVCASFICLVVRTYIHTYIRTYVSYSVCMFSIEYRCIYIYMCVHYMHHTYVQYRVQVCIYVCTLYVSYVCSV